MIYAVLRFVLLLEDELVLVDPFCDCRLISSFIWLSDRIVRVGQSEIGGRSQGRGNLPNDTPPATSRSSGGD